MVEGVVKLYVNTNDKDADKAAALNEKLREDSEKLLA